jgi:glycosyltransferase involved in cell wall biosynthesis
MTTQLLENVTAPSAPNLPTTLWMRERFGWMGSHSGYDRVFVALSEQFPSLGKTVWSESARPIRRSLARPLKRLASRAQTSPFYQPASTLAELKVALNCLVSHPQLVHIAYVENNLGLLGYYKARLQTRLVGTVHQPSSWWKLVHTHPESLTTLDTLIVLSSREKAYFETWLPGRVHFIPHGIDTDFFRPAEDNQSSLGCPRCVFAGTWLRDLATLSQVIDQVVRRNPAIHFDLVIPCSKRNDPYLYRIARHSQVAWHANLSNDALRRLYQKASLLFLPLLDCTANNALLEGIACGLPIVSNQVGGLPDYTRPSFAELCTVGDVEALTEKILALVDEPERQHHMGQAARKFAVDYLNWQTVALQTLEVYRSALPEEP